jgi:hypothetical protein
MSKVEQLYVMQYEDGNWVQRDDSSGPMSTGGYPFRVDKLSKATVWNDKKHALKYRETCRSDGPWKVFALELKTIPEIITPAEEAEARGDEEFIEFQRLAKKYGVTGTGECPYDQPWAGKCKRVPDVGELFCELHKGEQCYACGAQATSGCSFAGQFVCGAGQCDKHSHHH